jgi:putative thioredoxin
VLERLAGEYQGAFRLGKVDTEREPELAQAFGVQGIPFCVLVDGGRPVDGFQGVLPEAEVRAFLDRNGITPAVTDAAPAPAAAPAPVDPNSPAARYERAVAAARTGDAAAARALLAGIAEEDELHAAGQRLSSGLLLFEAALAAEGPPAEAALARARQRVLAQDLPGAMEAALESVAADRTFRNGMARHAMLLCFALVGEAAEVLDDYRRRLATLLY